MGDIIIQSIRFRDLNISDPFFNSLRDSYSEFNDWFNRKKNNIVYVTFNSDKRVIAFMYLKVESGAVTDTHPPINSNKILKVGTYKIDSPDTKLSERYIKKIFDVAIDLGIKHIYVTVFSKHIKLLDIFKRYGFFEYGKKVSQNGEEIVLLKDFIRLIGDIHSDYPIVDVRNRSVWLLGIYPEYHSRLFPDSKLNTEDISLVENLTYTNSINKVYIGKMGDMSALRPKDILVIYRTKEQNKSAEYSAVATSLCTIYDVKPMTDFDTFEDFYKHLNFRSVFSDDELKEEYEKKNNYIIRMTYNIAFKRRVVRHKLIEEVGLSRDDYFGLLSLCKEQFNNICKLGKVDESYIIN